MDENRLDALARTLAAAPTRRRSLGLLAGLGLGGLTALLGIPQEQVGETQKRNQKRNRKQKRRKNKRKNKPDLPRTDECATGTRPCNGTCIDNAGCCTNDDCANDQVCDSNQTCVAVVCPDGQKRCRRECISNGACCTDDECSGGKTCQGGTCTCPGGTKLCNDHCIPNSGCCIEEDCPDDRICQQEICVCPSGTKLCGENCIATSQCCDSADCDDGKTCEEGRCVGGGAPLYPELRTRPATKLSFDRLTDGTYVLRFNNTVWNAGEGRLEIEGNPNPTRNVAKKKIYQNLYDAPVGGELVSHKVVNSDLLYHPSHNHFHFSNFASYLLLKRLASGDYANTTMKGTKTSFCIMDTGRYSGSFTSQFQECDNALQGLSVGWGDTYTANLPDQWVVLGDQPLAEGEYGIQSTADPAGVLDEGGGERENNNVNVTYFTVSSGQISNIRQSP